MEKILIKGLKKEGPGDIVGAITSKLNISPKVIGNIEIKNNKAEVAVEEGLSDQIISSLDGDKVGNTLVEAKKIKNPKQQGYENYFEKYTYLIDKEREEEMRQHKQEIRKLSGREREQKGRAILHLRGSDQGEGLGGYRVKFMRNYKGEELPENEISVGDLVMISKQDPLREDNPTGTVVEKTTYSITVSFSGKPPGFVFSKDLRVDLYVNDITFQRMKEALSKLQESEGDLSALKNILIGESEPEVFEKENVNYWHNEELNDSQKKAVENALVTKDFYLIHGPPGTGKTTTTIEVIQQFVDRGQKVLATAAPNTAVDNILEFLIAQGVKTVRVGHPARVTPQLRKHTLDSLVENNSNYKKSKQIKKKAFELKDKQKELTYPSGKYRRGMSNEKIKKLAEKEKGSRGVSVDKIKEMAKAIEINEKLDDMFAQSRELEDKAVNEVINSVDVVCSTNSTSGTELIQNQNFDVVMIDEATQATETSCLIPIVHGSKVIMAGDHKQLPPTIKSREAAKQGLEETLFERLAYKYGDKIKDILTLQYRMHEKIMGFSNQQFYSGKLKASEQVKRHTLEDLDFDNNKVDPKIKKITDPHSPLVFINLSGVDVEEKTKKDSTSKYNPKEADIAINIAKNFHKGGIISGNIAVISPYEDQVDLISSRIQDDKLEVDTVDGFQGREKEVVIITLVRNNNNQEIGFLKDVRRLNVALTRAKRKLVVIGDESTLSTNEVYRDFINYAKEQGVHYDLVP